MITYIGKVIRLGKGSNAITIPKDASTKENLQPGDTVQITLQKGTSETIFKPETEQ